MALPAIDAIRSGWPAATIDVFVGRHSRDIFAFRPSLNVRPIPETLSPSTTIQLLQLLRHGRYDAAISLDRSRWLRLATQLSPTPVIAGIRSMTPELRHESDVYLDAVRDVGLATPSTIPHISPDRDADQRAGDVLRDFRHPIAVLHAGGAENPGVNMLEKRWPVDRYIELARALRRCGTTVLLSGGSADRNIAKRIASEAGIDDSAVLAGQTDLTTLAAILRHAAVFVGPDTGVSHLAAAVGTTTIAIFGPTNPRRYRPLGQRVVVLAPPESWNIVDRDLRRTSARSDTPSTMSVSLETVLGATRAAIERSQGTSRCDR